MESVAGGYPAYR